MPRLLTTIIRLSPNSIYAVRTSAFGLKISIGRLGVQQPTRISQQASTDSTFCSPIVIVSLTSLGVIFDIHLNADGSTLGRRNMKMLGMTVFAVILIVAKAVALEIDDSGSFYCEGEGSCGAGWSWDQQTNECIKMPMS